MKILFMGTPHFARFVLEGLYNEFEIIGLFTQPDKKVGRNQELNFPSTKEFLLEMDSKIPIFQPQKWTQEDIESIKMLSPDVIVVVAYGKILPKEVLSLSRCINVHASILPKYRGASPIAEMILNDENIFGVSIMDMAEGLDNGDILGISAFKREEYDNVFHLSQKLSKMGLELLINILKNLKNITPLKQNNIDSSYCKKISKEDGLIDFIDAKKIYLKSLAYYNWPGIFLENGLKLFEVELIEEKGSYQKGQILSISKDGIIIGCAKGSLKIKKLQASGKQRIDSKSYIVGKRLQEGDILK